MWNENEYEIGELANGYMVGLKQKNPSCKYILEYWDGKNWISEDNFKFRFNTKINDDSDSDPFSLNECDGCDEPFCSCGGKGKLESKNPIGEIKKLLDMADEINKEIRKRMAMLGGVN